MVLRPLQQCARRLSMDARRWPLVGVIDMENRDGTIYTPASAAEEIEQIELNGIAKVVYTGAASIEEVDSTLKADLSAVLIRRCAFDAPQLQTLPRLKSVLRMGAGYDNVNLTACANACVTVHNCPDAWVEEVADSTLSLMLALLRRTFDLSRLVTAGHGWTRQAELPQRNMKRLRGMRLGIIGLGRIGTAVAQRARPFGFEIGFYDPFLPAGIEKGLGGLHRAASFAELIASSDVLSFHCPLTELTRHMLNAHTLPPQHRGLYVLNLARGGVLDERALLDAIADGRVLGAALDSIEDEPRVAPELIAAQQGGANLLITPHAAFYSDDAFVEMRHLAAREVGRVLRGEPPHYRVG